MMSVSDFDFFLNGRSKISSHIDFCNHGLQTPNEGINQRNMKFWSIWQTKYALGVPKNLGLGFDLRSCSEGDFLIRRP